MEISNTPEPKELKEPKEPKESNYTNKISLEEYNKQKDDFTQKALKELSEQMKIFVKPNVNKDKSKEEFKPINISKQINNDDNDDNDDNYVNDDNDDNDDNCSESDYDTSLDNTKPSKSSINLIVQHVENKQKKRKVSHTQSKTQDTSMSDSIYAQHEVDMQTIQLLKDKINELKIENADLDSKKHYLTLDLNNAQCDVNEMKKQVSYLKDQLIAHKQFIKQMKKCDDEFAKILKLVAIGILLFILYYIKFLIF